MRTHDCSGTGTNGASPSGRTVESIKASSPNLCRNRLYRFETELGVRPIANASLPHSRCSFARTCRFTCCKSCSSSCRVKIFVGHNRFFGRREWGLQRGSSSPVFVAIFFVWGWGKVAQTDRRTDTVCVRHTRSSLSFLSLSLSFALHSCLFSLPVSFFGFLSRWCFFSL